MGVGVTLIQELGRSLSELGAVESRCIFDVQYGRIGTQLLQQMKRFLQQLFSHKQSTVYDRMTNQAKQALYFATAAAALLRQPAVGAEHLLLGLIQLTNSGAGKTFGTLGGSVPQAQAVLEAIGGVNQSPAWPDLELSSEVKTIINAAVDEAHRLQHQRLETGHLLLGVLQSKNPTIDAMLTAMHLSSAQVQDHMMVTLRNGIGLDVR
jgi:ATP-dependent Clp protease ATP-binding subunit ClpA